MIIFVVAVLQLYGINGASDFSDNVPYTALISLFFLNENLKYFFPSP